MTSQMEKPPTVEFDFTPEANPETGLEPFYTMETATPEQCRAYFMAGSAFYNEHLVPTIVDLLKLGQGSTFGASVDRYTHALQTATRAYRADARVDMVVGALLHDFADSFAPMNHATVAADVIQKYVDDETHWVVKHHTVFHGYHFWDKIGLDKDAREVYRGHKYFDATATFCADWDQVSFDSSFQALPIEFFMPALEEVFSREVRDFATSD